MARHTRARQARIHRFLSPNTRDCLTSRGSGSKCSGQVRPLQVERQSNGCRWSRRTTNGAPFTRPSARRCSARAPHSEAVALQQGHMLKCCAEILNDRDTSKLGRYLESSLQAAERWRVSTKAQAKRSDAGICPAACWNFRLLLCIYESKHPKSKNRSFGGASGITHVYSLHCWIGCNIRRGRRAGR